MRTLIDVHNHFNLRRLCRIEVSERQMARLEKPRELMNPYVSEDHVVTLKRRTGEVTLFPVFIGDDRFFVTPTPDAALAAAATP